MHVAPMLLACTRPLSSLTERVRQCLCPACCPSVLPRWVTGEGVQPTTGCVAAMYIHVSHMAFSHLFQGLQPFHEGHQNGEKMPPIPSRALGTEHSFLLPACLLALVTAFICPFSNSQLDLPQCPVFFLLLLTEPAGM